MKYKNSFEGGATNSYVYSWDAEVRGPPKSCENECLTSKSARPTPLLLGRPSLEPLGDSRFKAAVFSAHSLTGLIYVGSFAQPWSSKHIYWQRERKTQTSHRSTPTTNQCRVCFSPSLHIRFQPHDPKNSPQFPKRVHRKLFPCRIRLLPRGR